MTSVARVLPPLGLIVETSDHVFLSVVKHGSHFLCLRPRRRRLRRPLLVPFGACCFCLWSRPAISSRTFVHRPPIRVCRRVVSCESQPLRDRTPLRDLLRGWLAKLLAL